MSLQETVLAAFHQRPRSCIHQLIEATGLSRAELRYAVVELQKLKLIRKVSEVKGDYLYELVNKQVHRTEPIIAGGALSIHYKFDVDEDTAQRRVVMLKYMKSRLIQEWHPVLDKLLEDYESGLKAAEIARRQLEEIDADDYFIHVTTEVKHG